MSRNNSNEYKKAGDRCTVVNIILIGIAGLLLILAIAALSIVWYFWIK